MVSLGWASYLQARFTMLDGCNANGDPGANEIHLSVLLSVLVGVVAGVVAKRMRGWAAALVATLLTPVAFLDAVLVSRQRVVLPDSRRPLSGRAERRPAAPVLRRLSPGAA